MNASSLSIDQRLLASVERMEDEEPFSAEETRSFNALLDESRSDLENLRGGEMRRRCDLLARLMTAMTQREVRLHQQREEIHGRLNHIRLLDQWTEGARQSI